MKARALVLTTVATLSLVVSSFGTAHATSAGVVALSCKTDVVFAEKNNNQDCIGTADGTVVAPDGNILLIKGDPTWVAQKVTQPCGSDPKPRGGKCYDNFTTQDLVVDESQLGQPAVAFAWGRFKIACVDLTKNAPCLIQGSFDYTRVGNVAVVTIPSKHVLKNSKGKDPAGGIEIKEAGKSYGVCSANPAGEGIFKFIPKAVPTPHVKSNVWVTGTATVAC